MRVVLIGAGRLATNLGRALHEAGYPIVAVYSRTMASAEALTSVFGGFATNTIESLPTDADVYFFSVKDDVLPDLITQATRHILNLKPHCIATPHSQRENATLSKRETSKLPNVYILPLEAVFVLGLALVGLMAHGKDAQAGEVLGNA